MSYIKFNLNEYFKVKLTDEGLKYYISYFNKHLPENLKVGKPYFDNKIDSDGYFLFQAHEFIKAFGQTITWKAKYFDINILVQSN